jgi:hypothetical protein
MGEWTKELLRFAPNDEGGTVGFLAMRYVFLIFRF